MVFDQIEKLKRDFTDKYVIVDESRPELRRFKGMTGTVKTVNMNGRALVEFDANNNIGWFDIALDFLKVIDQPLPKPEAKEKKAEKAPAEKKAPAAKPAAEATPKPAAAGAKMSVADMLAAARAGGAKPAAAPAAKKEAPAPKPEPVAEPAAEEPAAEEAPAPAPVAEKKKPAAGGAKPTNTADILAMCRKLDTK